MLDGNIRFTKADNRLLKIAYVVPSLGISGGINKLFEYAHRLQRRGHDVIVLNADRLGPTADWHPIKDLRILNTDDIWTLRAIGAQEFDVVVATGWQTVYELLRIGLRARAFAYHVQCNEILFNPRGSWSARLASFTYRLPFHFLTVSRWLEKWLKEEYGQIAKYVPDRYNPEFIYQTEPLAAKPPGKVRVLLEGALCNPWKRMDDSFLAVRGVDAEIWCLSGAGDLKPWQQPHRFFSQVPYGDVKAIMSSCDVLLKLSEIEGCFGPPLEMMACGGTAIVTKVAGYDEYIDDGVNALAVDIGDYRSAREKLKTLIGDGRLRERLIEGGRQTAVAFSNWEESVDQVEEYFRNILAQSETLQPQPLRVPEELNDMAQLALDIRYSRHSDDPLHNRRNWMTLYPIQPVKCDKVDDFAMMMLSGEADATLSVGTSIWVDGAINEDAMVSLSDVGADKDQPFRIGAVFERDQNDTASALPEDEVPVLRLTGPEARSRVLGSDDAMVQIKEAKILECYRISIALSAEQWPEEQGDNYAVILSYFCEQQPHDIVLCAPQRDRRLHYPPIRIESAGHGPGSAYVQIDTIQVYPGKPTYDFLLFVDVPPLAMTAQPGALR